MITVESLTRAYAGFTAVDNVSFTALPGRVTGFLGPNGAGKSTTMRVLVGLTVPTSGTATIDGVRFADLPNPGREVGVLLDASAQHAGRTGREILTIASDTMGLPRTRVDEMIELVSLTPTEAKRRVRNYSLGMRQRLGIATALLGDPQVLILDEPANGLDPAGIRWMRDLLTRLRQPGRHRAAVLTPAPRDRGHRRRPGRDRERQDRRGRQQGRAARRGRARSPARRHRATSRTPWSRPGSPAPSPATARSARMPVPLGSGPWP